MSLRQYQQDALGSILSGFSEYQRQLAVLPTGAGKTLLFSHLAASIQPRKTLILAHREELIDQAIDKLHRATGIKAQKEMAEWSAHESAPVVVASIQSMTRRLDRWNPNHFGLVVADEAHHSISDSWQKVLNYFDKAAWVLGVTATPDRGDRRNLGSYYENVAFEIGLFDLVHQGYLSPISIKSIPLQIDLSQVKQSAGDFSESDLGNALRPYLAQIAQAIAEEACFRRVLCFLPLIATSQEFVAHCRKVGINAHHVDGKDPMRAEKLADFAAGRFDLLSNAMLLTEGYDCPAVDCVVVLRPTRSRPLYSQMVGRGTRVTEAKSNLLLLDFLWMHEKHSLIRPAHLIAKTEDEAKQITELAQEKASGDGEIDLEDVATDAREQREERLRKELEAHKHKKGKTISADEFALQNHAVDVAEFEPSFKWESEPVTEKQAKWLKQAHIDIDTVRGKGHATKLLGIHFAHQALLPASDKTKAVMRRKGYANADVATRADEKRFWAQMRAKV